MCACLLRSISPLLPPLFLLPAHLESLYCIYQCLGFGVLVICHLDFISLHLTMQPSVNTFRRITIYAIIALQCCTCWLNCAPISDSFSLTVENCICARYSVYLWEFSVES